MRMKYQMVIALIFVLAGFSGIVSADPCPSLNAVKSPNGYGTVTNAISGIEVTYSMIVTGSLAVKGLCIYEIDLAGLDTSLVQVGTSPLGWSFFHPDSHNYFEWSGSGTQALLSGQSSTIGTVNFGNNPLPTSSETYAIHVLDPNGEVCGSDDTCWVYPGPGVIIPELNPMILTVTGLFGLVLLSRKYKKIKMHLLF